MVHVCAELHSLVFKKIASTSDDTKSKLAQATEEKERLQKEKMDEVSALTSKLHSMEKSYEAILQVWACLRATCK